MKFYKTMIGAAFALALTAVMSFTATAATA